MNFEFKPNWIRHFLIKVKGFWFDYEPTPGSKYPKLLRKI